MAKTRQQKEQAVKELVENFQQMKSAVFLDYRGLTVAQTETLRKQLKPETGQLKMCKRSLLALALKGAKLEQQVSTTKVPGSLSLAFGLGDELAPAKISAKFKKEHEALQILGGILAGKFLTPEEVMALALIPSQQELLARLVGSLAAPLRGLVTVLQGNLRGLVVVLKAIQEKKAV